MWKSMTRSASKQTCRGIWDERLPPLTVEPTVGLGIGRSKGEVSACSCAKDGQHCNQDHHLGCHSEITEIWLLRLGSVLDEVIDLGECLTWDCGERWDSAGDDLQLAMMGDGRIVGMQPLLNPSRCTGQALRPASLPATYCTSVLPKLSICQKRDPACKAPNTIGKTPGSTEAVMEPFLEARTQQPFGRCKMARACWTKTLQAALLTSGRSGSPDPMQLMIEQACVDKSGYSGRLARFSKYSIWSVFRDSLPVLDSSGLIQWPAFEVRTQVRSLGSGRPSLLPFHMTFLYNKTNIQHVFPSNILALHPSSAHLHALLSLWSIIDEPSRS